MSKHTPGSWDYGRYGAEIGWTVKQAHGSCRTIAHLEDDQTDGVPEANARLIAAAPTMLAALKEAEKVLKTQNHGNCLASVLDAIRQAEGG